MNRLSQIGNANLNFGAALDLAKQGKLVAREGWNGKGMFIFMRPGDHIPVKNIENIKTLPDAVKEYFKNGNEIVANGITAINEAVDFTPYLCMKAADNTIVNGWLASQTDMLANDWVEVQV